MLGAGVHFPFVFPLFLSYLTAPEVTSTSELAGDSFTTQGVPMLGTTVSHYQILEKLGEGGMGVVYKAHDTKLDRDVALKFLPHHVIAAEAEQARFLQEARAAARLSHPNICTVYGIENVDSCHFIVMEYVEGKTLREKMKSGAGGQGSGVRAGEAIGYAIQIAEGLAAAHDKGIVHRDIKPENIMIRKDGVAQIMDFGLAILEDVSRLTKQGSTVGTIGYMSPEQLQGEEVDYRTDIFSLGVVLYELITGESPFHGAHEAALMYEIVNATPRPPSEIKPEIDPQLDHIILECLEKKRDERCQSARELAKNLRLVRKSTDGRARASFSGRSINHGELAELPKTNGTKDLKERRTISTILVAVAVCGIIAALVFGFLYFGGNPPEKYPIRFTVAAPPGTNIVPGSPAVSPDSKVIAFTALDSSGRASLWLRPIELMRATSVANAEVNSIPFWSPDGRFCCFFADRKLKKMELSTKALLTVCDAPDASTGSWGRDNIILFAADWKSPIYKVSADGGTPIEVTKLEEALGEEVHYRPQFLPDGHHFVYAAFSRIAGFSAYYVASTDNESRVRLMDIADGSSPNISVVPPDNYLFVKSNSLVMQRFDRSTCQLLDQPLTLADSVGHFAASEDLLVSQAGGKKNYASSLVLFDRSGKRLHVESELGVLLELSVSPDQNNVIYHRFSGPGEETSFNQDLWLLDRKRGTRSRITFERAADIFPVWLPNGREIIYASSRDSAVYDLYRKVVSSNAEAELILKSGAGKFPVDCSKDGKYLLYGTQDGTLEQNWVLPLVGEKMPFRVVSAPGGQFGAAFSPDSRFLTYSSSESGRPEVYLQTFPDGKEKWQVSKEGGNFPRWRPDGKELYYRSAQGKLVAVEIQTSPTVTIGLPKVLFDISPMGVPNMYAVLENGNRFLVNEISKPTETAEPFEVVMNWRALLHER